MGWTIRAAAERCCSSYHFEQGEIDRVPSNICSLRPIPPGGGLNFGRPRILEHALKLVGQLLTSASIRCASSA
jgi:hypothetical protein